VLPSRIQESEQSQSGSDSEHSSAQGDGSPQEMFLESTHRLPEVVVHSDVLLLCAHGASSKRICGDLLVEAHSASK